MKKKLLKIVLYLFIFGLLCGFGVYMYVFHKPHRNIGKEKPAYIVSAKVLLKQFSDNQDSIFKLYANKAIQVTGSIANIDNKDSDITITLGDPNTGVSCSLEDKFIKKEKARIDALKVGDKVTIKGKCDGYDMIMGVVLTRCVLIPEDE